MESFWRKAGNVARLAVLSLPMAALALPAMAEDKPKGHGDTPGAKYEPSLTTLGQAKIEMHRRKIGPA
mgnify:CR=1 FL=1